MSLNSRPQPRPMNPPPADAFTNYRPTAPASQQQQQQSGGPPPQRNNSLGNSQGDKGASGAGAGAGGSSKPPPLTLEQSRAVARTHYTALKGWLAKEGALASGSTRTNAREKLTRLTRQQFQELSTDVYDELVRRMEDASGRPGEQPFLAVRSDFHPKRNQARQKLATLPLLRFRDLASDVYFELDRRYPEFSEEEDNPDGQAFSPSPSANTPTTPYGAALSSQPHSRNGSLASQTNNNNNGMASPPLPSNLNARRAPTPQQQQGQSTHSPQQSHSYAQSHGSSPSGGSSNPPPSAGLPAGNDVVVPNKSTMIVEEDPPAPSSRPMYGRASPSNGGGGGFGSGSNPTSPSSDSGPSAEDRRGSVERSLSPSSGMSTSAGLNFGAGGRSLLASPPLGGGGGGAGAHGGASPSSRDRDNDDEAEELAPPPTRGGAKGGQHQSMASETSSIGTRFFGGYAGSAAASEAGGRRSWDYDPAALEKVKSEYEYKLTMLQNRVGELERENDDAAAALKGRRGEEERVRELEREVREGRERFDDQSAQLRSLQRDHDTLRASSSARSAPSASSPPSSGGDAQLRTRLHEAEELANELRGEVSSLVDEIRQVNERCDELQREVEREREERERIEKESEGWKGRWQQAKLELRNIKATSQLFSSSISVDADYMPASSDGLIKDTSVAAFQTSIDDLLQAARSKEPSSVLPAARTVVSACEKLDNDIQAIPPNRLASLPPSDQDLVNSLKAKVNATLSNLMTASKNHAMSFGVSPVSLLDAAASHLAATIVELVRILKIRRTTGSGGGGGSRMSLDPSAAFGFGRNGPGGGGGLGHGLSSHAHEPMPPLPENMQPIQVHVPTGPVQPSRDTSPDVGPAPPAKEREAPKQQPQPQQLQQEEQKKERSPGYLSGGMSSLLGGGAGSVTKALEAMGISSGKRASVDSQDEREKQPASQQQQQQTPRAPQQQQQPTPTRESFAFSDMSLDSSARASPIPPAGGAQAHDFAQQSSQRPPQRFDSYDHHSQQQQQDASAYPQYGQGLARDVSNSSLAYRSDSPPPQSYGQQHQQHDDRFSAPYGSNEPSRNGDAAYEHGADYQSRGQEQYGQQGEAGGYGEQMNGGQDEYRSPGLSRSERNPEELRAYIENQTEAIVHSIQSLLSAIRSGAQGSELSDNLTQIITIVSSIVAISQAALPPHAREEGNAILDDLTTHCDKLSEMQNASHGGGNGADAFTKQTKQAMAAASFGVAKHLKALNSLLQGEEGLV
ncbi:hypothetical protein JCM6882_009488 [Rhodosporidiobolus microsporus]